MKLAKLLVSFVIIFHITLSQDSSYTFNKITKDIYDAFNETLSWYDLPIFLTNKYSKNIFGSDGRLQFIKLSPFKFEKDFNNTLSSMNSYSFGSIDKDIFPTVLITSRITLSLGRVFLMDDRLNKDDLKHTLVFYKSIVYTNAITEIVKGIVHKNRPDNSDTRSFFSGHSSTTFAATTFIYREIKDFYNSWELTENNEVLKNCLTATSFVTLYGWSSYVAYSRVKDNKHYLLDVFIGAAVGTLISNLLYDYYFAPFNTLSTEIEIDHKNNVSYFGISFKL